MPRKKTVAVQEQQQAEAPDPMVNVVQEMKDKLGAEVVEAPPPGERAATLPEPHELDSIELGPQKGGPRMRLFRSNRFQQMQIRFDEKPPEDGTALLKEEGWRWRGQETGWTKQLDKEAKWRTQADAERLFKEVADGIRAQKDLGPVVEFSR